MQFSIWDNQRLAVWYCEQFGLHPEGLLPVNLAARLCGCERDAILKAVSTGKMRMATFSLVPPVRLVPFVDVCQWQASRYGRLRWRDWPAVHRDNARRDHFNLERVGNVVFCTSCGRSDAIQNVRPADAWSTRNRDKAEEKSGAGD